MRTKIRPNDKYDGTICAYLSNNEVGLAVIEYNPKEIKKLPKVIQQDIFERNLDLAKRLLKKDKQFRDSIIDQLKV